jgi:hypothetical protein
VYLVDKVSKSEVRNLAEEYRHLCLTTGPKGEGKNQSLRQGQSQISDQLYGKKCAVSVIIMFSAWIFKTFKFY